VTGEAVPGDPGGVEDLLRELAPQVLGALVRRYGQFHLCEDASQEALLAAALQWPAGGIPENPSGWLITVASRRPMDQMRSEQSRRNREELIAVATPQSELLGPPADAEPADRDDSLALLFGCCHPPLSSPSQIALTLRSVGGLAADKRMARHHRLLATRAHLREMAGDRQAAAADYLEAACRTTSRPERRYLAAQAARLDEARQAG
jgi:predicted RNA polymerase sigma factor